MEKSSKIVYVLIIVAGFFWLGGGLKNCQSGLVDNCPELAKSDTIILIDTIFDTIPGKPISQAKQIDSIPYAVETIGEVDTSAIIADYLMKRIYVDSMKDERMLIIVYDTIGANKLLGRYLEYHILRPQTIVKSSTVNNYYKPRSGFYLGLSAGKNQAGPAALFVRPKWAGSASYDFINRGIHASTFFNIGFNKR